jgi:hypothetical protein
MCGSRALSACWRQEARTRRYVDQMREFILIIPGLEDIEQDVAASKRLFTKPDREQIRDGIGLIVCYLERLCDEYARWATSTPPGSRWRDEPEIGDFTKEKAFPVEYDVGISRSKGVIRRYVYGYGDTTERPCPEPPRQESRVAGEELTASLGEDGPR